MSANMKISNSTFIGSCQRVEDKPKRRAPEFAFIGRSNVGKSSLINMLCAKKDLARTSAMPGKTVLINHFMINDSWYLVDLPGYGFAKLSKVKQQQLKKMTDTWNFMRTDILPRLRRVDIVINYARGTIVEERTLIEPVLEETVVEEVVVPRSSCCAECGVANCACGNDCTCNGNGMIIEVDDQLLQMVEGVVTEQIDTELIEVGIPANRAQNR